MGPNENVPDWPKCQATSRHSGGKLKSKPFEYSVTPHPPTSNAAPMPSQYLRVVVLKIESGRYLCNGTDSTGSVRRCLVGSSILRLGGDGSS